MRALICAKTTEKGQGAGTVDGKNAILYKKWKKKRKKVDKVIFIWYNVLCYWRRKRRFLKYNKIFMEVYSNEQEIRLFVQRRRRQHA